MSEQQSSTPSYENKEFFIRALNGHSKVSSIRELSGQLYIVTRTDNSAITIYLTNKYIVGIADYLDFINENSDINCIVTISTWNSYTDDAKNRSLDNKIGLFNLSEFLGALHKRDFWSYVKKDN